jgi:hypothetical protein
VRIPEYNKDPCPYRLLCLTTHKAHKARKFFTVKKHNQIVSVGKDCLPSGKTASRSFLAVVQAEHVILHVVVPWALHQMEHLHHTHNVMLAKRPVGIPSIIFSMNLDTYKQSQNQQIYTNMIKVIHEFKTIIMKAKR